MADVKISQLPQASFPLTGTEVFPLVQNGVTVQAPVLNTNSATSISALRGTTPTNGATINVDGYYAAGDGGGGQFYAVTGAATGTYVDNGGTIILPTNGDGSSAWLRVYDGVINVKWFGAKGDGNTDDTNSILAAATVCNAAKRTGLVASIFHPGLTLDFDSGTYYLGTNAATIPIECNVTHSGAGVLVNVGFSGEVFRLGMDVSVQLLATANIVLPDVYKPTLSPQPYTGTGVRIKNLNASSVTLGRVDYFDKCHHFGGKGQGTVYCDIYLGQSAYGKTLIHILPETGGWCNTNNIFGGNLFNGGTRKSGSYHLYMDGSTSSTIYGNNFYGTSFEGDGSQYIIYVKSASNNNFYGSYFETGRPPQSVTVSGGGSAAITLPDHGFSVGDSVAFFATVLPTGMLDSTQYYVTATPTLNTFEVSINKSGTSQTFATAGTNVNVFLQPIIYFDNAAGNTTNNTLDQIFTVPSLFLNVVQTAPGLNNGLTSRGNRSTQNFRPNDIPPFRSGNTSFASGLTLAQFAAYDKDYNPDTQPLLWSTALSPNGIYYKNPATNTMQGRLFCTFNTMRFISGTSSTQRDIPSAVRSATSTNLTFNLDALGGANDASTQAITLAGAAVGDYVIVSYLGSLPAGVVQAWARVTATDTVSICFQNVSSGAKTITNLPVGVLVYGRFI